MSGSVFGGAVGEGVRGLIKHLEILIHLDTKHSTPRDWSEWTLEQSLQLRERVGGGDLVLETPTQVVRPKILRDIP